MIVYFYFKEKPFKQEGNLVYLNGHILNYDIDIDGYETNVIVTLDIDLYLDLLLIKSKYKNYTHLNMSNEVHVESDIIHIDCGKVSGSDRKGNFKTLEEIWL